jgi:ubiquinone/menaquinone biosynthesis C-methylase UbiE
METRVQVQEKNVSDAFSRQSGIFDELDKKDEIIQWMRARVRAHVLRHSRPGKMLELNCGTGLDAVFFAEHGYEVLATDNSPGMLEELKKKIYGNALQHRIRVQQCSFHALETLGSEPFDHVFSNFGGLNCTDDLERVIRKIRPLLKPGGIATLVIMPRICPWEISLALKGSFRLARRRFSRQGAESNVEGVQFRTWYYSPRYLKRAFGKNFETIALSGLASVHPPPYLENFPKKFPGLSAFLRRWDERLQHLPFFRSCADHYIISMKNRVTGTG